jgi:hypothetical protein
MPEPAELVAPLLELQAKYPNRLLDMDLGQPMITGRVRMAGSPAPDVQCANVTSSAFVTPHGGEALEVDHGRMREQVLASDLLRRKPHQSENRRMTA